MGMGIAFTFLGLAALAAPVIWLVWFAADSVGTRPRAVPVPSPGGPSPTPAYFDYPLPADSRRPGRPDGITVYNLFGGAPKAYCEGPDARGACPITRPDGTVPCAGCLLVLPEPVRGSRDWHIPAGYRSCLVGSYATYRQGVK
jgi:hypothetical protein